MSAADDLELRRLVRALSKMASRGAQGAPGASFGVVHAVTPLEVVLDGTTTPVPAYALTSYTSRAVGQRVFCHLVRNEIVVAGAVSRA